MRWWGKFFQRRPKERRNVRRLSADESLDAIRKNNETIRMMLSEPKGSEQ